MNELERHRIARRFTEVGWPIYEDDEIVGVYAEPLWSWDDLTAEQQATIRQETMRLQTGRSLSWDEAYPFMLGEYGIHCPHKWRYREPILRECEWCHVAEPLPGRVVRVAGRALRVTDPPPPVLRVPRAVTPSLDRGEPDAAPEGPEVDEYRWTGTRYIASR